MFNEWIRRELGVFFTGVCAMAGEFKDSRAGDKNPTFIQ